LTYALGWQTFPPFPEISLHGLVEYTAALAILLALTVVSAGAGHPQQTGIYNKLLFKYLRNNLTMA
jgi:hypothetical protein